MATVIVKLGGAAITQKSKADTLSPDLDTLVAGIAQVCRDELRPRGTRLILIHGAGSFGHPPAKKYRVKAGWSTTRPNERTSVNDVTQDERHRQQVEQRESVKFGMAFTRQRVLQLHHHVLQRLQDRGRLPVLSVSPYDTVETDRGELTLESGSRLVTRVQKLLAQGFIPVLFGDAVLDIALGTTILSGDALMHKLATELLEVRRCVFVTDVAGIYTRDPKRFEDATLIHQLRCSSEQEIDESDASAGVDDVTGAMSSKWQWTKRIMADAPHICQVIICQASDSDKALCVTGEGVDGSDDCGDITHTWTTILR